MNDRRSSEGTSALSGLSFRALFRAAFLRPSAKLTPAEAASTIYRFFRSKHVVDLKLFAMIAIVIGTGSFLVICLKGILLLLQQHHIQTGSSFDPILDALAADAGKVLGVSGIIVAWAYRSACTRLGVVDLFACEVGTLCRVGSLFNIGRKYIAEYDADRSARPQGIVPQRAQPASFVSEEEYFPVFQNNTGDLQLLEATVVKNITEFYTYMKAMRDALRRLAELGEPQVAEPAAAASAQTSEPDAWHAALFNVIFLLFLAYESGRKAITDLVEFEPAAAETKVVILLTEMQAYGFLLRHIAEDDVRYRRLKLREQEYRAEVGELVTTVDSHSESEKEWLPAKRTIDELAKRYRSALRGAIDAPQRCMGSDTAAPQPMEA